MSKSTLPISKNTLVCGVGVNDAEYSVRTESNGKYVICAFYTRWTNMLERCYSEKSILKNPTYINCTVCDDWLIFSNFKKWMEKQDWRGKSLDKDILVPGNKIYGPETCIFVTTELNNILCSRDSCRGILPKGVCYHKGGKKFMASISILGKLRYLGLYKTQAEASYIYRRVRVSYIREVALDYIKNKPLYKALMSYGYNVFP